jgi:hypothetical protein
LKDVESHYMDHRLDNILWICLEKATKYFLKYLNQSSKILYTFVLQSPSSFETGPPPSMSPPKLSLPPPFQVKHKIRVPSVSLFNSACESTHTNGGVQKSRNCHQPTMSSFFLKNGNQVRVYFFSYQSSR